MSKLSFKTFCIELYAEHIATTGTEVYTIFKTSGLLELLDSDYDDLHGMSMDDTVSRFQCDCRRPENYSYRTGT